MPIFVNGEEVPEQLINEEVTRLRLSPEWKTTAARPSDAILLYEAAETGAIDRVLLRQVSEKDASPIDPAELAKALQVARTAPGCRTGVNEEWLRGTIERNMRFMRTMRSLLVEMRCPSRYDVRCAYEERRGDYRIPEEVSAAHIVCNIDELHSEGDARGRIEASLSALENGTAFDQVVELYSDCKEKGGDLGFFARGVMVREFDEVVFSLVPGERSAIFRTPFGFHIAEVRGKKPPRIAEFEEVAPQIERTLLAAAEQNELRRVFGELRRHAAITRTGANSQARATTSFTS